MNASSLARFWHEQRRPYDPMMEPQPLRLHWAWLVIVSVVLGYWTGALFLDVWLVLQANWIRRANGRGLGLKLTLWGVGIDGVSLLISLLAKIPHLGGVLSHVLASAWMGLPGWAVTILYVATICVMYRDLRDEPIGLPLRPVMTFFFAPYYFQYWLQDYSFTRLRSPSLTGIPLIENEQSL